MALPIRWSPKAAHQLETIVEYIAQDSERYATVVAHKLVQSVKEIPTYPSAGRVVPEYGDQNVRERFRLGYRIVYRPTPHAVEIVAICHGARLIQNAMKDSK